ncbi:MAG: DUF2158 domain-containing protein [bacterium]
MGENKNMKVGDVVKLKSGGLAMTIIADVNEKYFESQWFDKDGKLQKAVFLKEALYLEEEEINNGLKLFTELNK